MSRACLVIVAVMLASLAATGCNSRRSGGRRPTDSGSPPTGDSGPMTGRDSGGIMLMDSGPGPMCVINADCAGGLVCEGGNCVPGGPTTETNCSNMIDDDGDGPTDCADSDCAADSACAGPPCAEDRVDAVVGGYCSSTTADCISEGSDPSTCLAADPSPDCSACFNLNLIACGNRNGCQRLWDLYTCCVTDNCGTMPTSACIDSSCSTTRDAYSTCLDGLELATLCPTALSDCF